MTVDGQMLAKCDVVHMVNQMRPGGIETMVCELVRLSRHASCVFSLEGNTGDLVRGWPGLAPLADQLEGFNRAPRLEPALIFRLARRLRELSPRTVFLHRINPLFYGGLAARLARVSTVVHVEHDVWQYEDPRRLDMLKWVSRIVRPTHFAISDAIASKLREIRPAADIRVVQGGVDLTRFRIGNRHQARDILGLPRDIALIGTAGRLEAVKGHRVLIAAVPHLHSNVHVVLIGNGSERDRLVGLARELGISDRAHFLGHRDDIDRILAALDVFCLPSLSEGLPRVLMEAQAAGIPVVASDVGSVRQVVDPATGRVVVADDPVALATALSECLAHPASAQACRAFAESRFSIERMIARYDDMTVPADLHS